MHTSRPLLVILDDDDDIRDVLARYLSMSVDPARYSVVALTTMEELVALLPMHPIPLLVTDYRLGPTTGLAVATWVKRHSPMTRILLITVEPLDLRPGTAGAAFLDGTLEKPFSLDLFESWCSDALHAWEALQEAPVAG